jgi:hypothetical protein
LDALLSADETSQGLLLLVDEAQALAVHLLEELRLLTNLARGGSPRVRLVLAGLPALEEKLASPELQSFSQRLSARCYLAPLTRAETAQYVRAQLAASAVDPERLFASTSFDAIYNATDGVPRLVNQVCDRSLVFADTLRLDTIDPAVIQAAWADLQQLPTPWESSQQATARPASSVSVVEFGNLDSELTEHKPAAQLVTASACDDPTELDEEELTSVSFRVPPPAAEPPASSPVRRPRVVRGPVPDAVDPFADRFEEEELVLDSFATLAGIFRPRTPRVENQREPAFSRMLQHALDAASPTTTGDHSTQNAEAAERAAHERPLERSAIRLAMVPDAVPPAVNDIAGREFRTNTSESVQSHREDEIEIAPRRQPGTVSELPGFEDTDDAIIVIEDDPAADIPLQPGVRRENYRQLFSRLRHGT